jgi:hypothetical protein
MLTCSMEEVRGEALRSAAREPAGVGARIAARPCIARSRSRIVLARVPAGVNDPVARPQVWVLGTEQYPDVREVKARTGGTCLSLGLCDNITMENNHPRVLRRHHGRGDAMFSP